MHNDFAAQFTRPIVRRIRSRRLLRNVVIATVCIAGGTAQAGLIEWVWDWWNRPSPPSLPDTGKPVTKTVRVIGAAAA